MSIEHEPRRDTSARSSSADSDRVSGPPVLCCGLTALGIVKLCLVLAIIVALVLALTIGNLTDRIGDLLTWLDNNRLPGVFIFVSVYALLTSLFFPSSVLTLAGGAIFGAAGIPMVWVGACLGQTGAFVLSRYLLHDFAKSWSTRYRVWDAVDAAISQQGLKIAILVRLATLVPYSVANALLPVTSITFRDYTIGSAVGIIPGVCLYVMIGHLASSVVDVVKGNVKTDPTVLIVTVVVSIVVLLAVVILLTRYAKRALRARLEAEDAATEQGTMSNAASAMSSSTTEQGGSPDSHVALDFSEAQHSSKHDSKLQSSDLESSDYSTLERGPLAR